MSFFRPIVRRRFVIFAPVFVAACTGGTVSQNTTTSTTPTGGVPILGFIVQGETAANGTINGVPSSATTVVTKGTDGYSYATSLISASTYSQTAAAAGGQAYVGVAGILPTTNVGTPPTSGTASYKGNYQLTYVAKPADGSAPTTSDLETATGAVTLDADFSRSTISPSTTASTGQPLTLADFASVGDTLLLIATYRNVPGTLSGKIGTTRAVGAMAGSGPNGIFAGGLIADR